MTPRQRAAEARAEYEHARAANTPDAIRTAAQEMEQAAGGRPTQRAINAATRAARKREAAARDAWEAAQADADKE